MTSILRSGTTSVIGFTLCVLIGVSCLGTPALSAEEEAPPADETLLADAESRRVTGSPGWRRQKAVAHYADVIRRSKTRG